MVKPASAAAGKQTAAKKTAVLGAPPGAAVSKADPRPRVGGRRRPTAVQPSQPRAWISKTGKWSI